MALTLVVDVGNYSTKYTYEWEKKTKCGSFSSVLHTYKKLDSTEGDLTRFKFGALDYWVGEDVKNFYMGKEDRMYFGNVRKGHREAQIRLVAALYKVYEETGENEFNLILTSPYESMQKDTDYFKENIKGEQSAYVDNSPFQFTVKNLIVVAEGLGALNFTDEVNCVIVDAGSKTLNILYLINGNISRDDSHTLNGGTLDNNTYTLANNFFKACSYIDLDYPVICTGGKAKELSEDIQELGFENVTVVDLEIGTGKNKEKQPPYYVNAVGLLMKYGKQFEAMFA
ncbi:hypothetical protein [Priestia megaterium]|uniref:ParM/StbA family protein n=1 Tax=Priestia megaterium TaxID=1404 RepID=UPI000BED4281|nr:hypothetical protein [Priestia megaterium]PED64042.1 hypothetical protein CON20_24065 [Priestia megaterium]